VTINCIKHRKTRVREESWPLIDGWYFCPEPVVDERIKEEEKALGSFRQHTALSYEFIRWSSAQYDYSARLAHQCEDGGIRAPSWIQFYEKKSGGISIYGGCKKCEKKLSDGIKTIMIMEEM
jgi:hypothetical protein